MKKTRKLWAFLLAMIMVLAMGMSAMAADTGSITITPPTGTDANATNTYKIYKVFDASAANDTTVSYKLVSGKTTAPAGFTVDSAGNVTYSGVGTDTNGDGVVDELTAADIAAIAEYVKNDTPVATKTTTGTDPAVASNLPNGYYYITTSTGTVVTIDSTTPNATVNDKNTVPQLDKTITKVNTGSWDADGKNALAQLGTTVLYEAKITVGNGAKGYVFYDKMSDGLSFGGDVRIKCGENILSQNTHYLYEDDYSVDGPYTIKISFIDDYMKNLEAGTEIIITYSATINENAIKYDSVNNTAYLSYGDENSNNRTPNSETEVYNAKITVTKKDGNDAPLAGAGFVIKNAEDKYYKLTGTVVSWVASIDAATEYTSAADGTVQAFTGLANGTYTLVEKTVPAGYNKAADSTFTIAEHDYTAANLKQTATVTNNKGAELPSTGGIGTTMFYVAGGALVLAAVVLLVTRKRMSVEK